MIFDFESEYLYKLQEDIKANGFETIRFASYRTGAKLRFVQKKTHLNNVDIWNFVEALKEACLSGNDHDALISSSELLQLFTSLYQSMNKRLPPSQHVRVNNAATTLVHWLLAVYKSRPGKSLRLFSVKVALATMAAGKIMDKLRYLFSLLCDSNGKMLPDRFHNFLEDILAIPSVMCESPTFSFKEELLDQVFSDPKEVTITVFIDLIMSDPIPDCLVWLPLLHRISTAENVIHDVPCSSCPRESYIGFRYNCQRCPDFNQCQDCFWLGRVSQNHSTDHEMKEIVDEHKKSMDLEKNLVGTIQSNLIANAPLLEEKVLNKKGRGTSDEIIE
ncbi:hypothetical protein QYM36_001019 [Artemia franciscana]|uniref:ZZ-type domain-containing protein n=1 Tax=Artemia franciscana TaxID=6661 RepID=A0AA88LJP3_ARTSF|nr:hypothetical protein QYM36_001019 [Artemia franciscana]